MSDNGNNNRRKYSVCVVSTPITDNPFVKSIKRMENILVAGGNNPTFISGKKTLSTSGIKSDKKSIPVELSQLHPVFREIAFQIFCCYTLILQRDRYDICLFYKGGMSLVLPCVVCKLLGIPVCVVKSGAYLHERSLRHHKFIQYTGTFVQKANFKLADSVIVFGENAIGSVPNNNTYVASPEYIDVENFSCNLDYQKREKIIGFVGRIEEVKGVEKLCKALKKQKIRDRDIKAILIGDGSKLEKLEENYSCGTIEFTGWVDHSDLPEFYNKMKILVVPSEAEGGPITAMEAMACGTPVLGTRVGILPDLINADNGVLIEKNDPEHIADNIISYFDKPMKETISSNSRRTIEENYSLGPISEKYNHVLKMTV